jgi:hypothetical protein
MSSSKGFWKHLRKPWLQLAADETVLHSLWLHCMAYMLLLQCLLISWSIQTHSNISNMPGEHHQTSSPVQHIRHAQQS